jgi:hypothetical protein
MSRRKKNAGEGYGMMFHGSFGTKAKAVAKEKKTPGAFVKGTLTNKGYRYLVMSPRTNPIKRKRHNPKRELFVDNRKFRTWESAFKHAKKLAKKLRDRVEVLVREDGHELRHYVDPPGYNPRAAHNPHELLVMGANPSEIDEHHTQEISLPPGATIVIRTPRQNPEPRANVELGTFENGVFHPWTRRPRSRQKKAIRRQNTSAAALREEFTGVESDGYTVHDEAHMPAGDYAELGKLLELYVKPVGGSQVQQITFKAPFPVVVSDESGRQIYFVGGDQDVSAALGEFGAHDRGAGLYVLGEARRIDYKQRKEHVPDPETDEWRHDFGEETGEYPVLVFDSKSKRLELEGGTYEIRTEGIVN